MTSKEFLAVAHNCLSAYLKTPSVGDLYFKTKTESYSLSRLKEQILELLSPDMTEDFLVEALYATLEKKNADYSPDNSAFYNFERAAEEVGLTVSDTIRVRVVDKISRMNNLMKKGKPAVEDEPLVDTLMDIMNYMIILEIYENKENWENIGISLEE